MIEFTFADGEEMGAYDGERVITFKSAFIDKYKDNAQAVERAAAWKTTGRGAIFREAYSDPSALTFESSVTGVYPGEGDEVVYTKSGKITVLPEIRVKVTKTITPEVLPAGPEGQVKVEIKIQGTRN